MRFDHRAARRLHLKKPAPGLFSMWQVKILDVSETGIGVVHDGNLKPGDKGYLEFRWNDATLTLSCTVVHSRPVGLAFRTTEAAIPANEWVGKPPQYRSGLRVSESGSRTFSEYRQRVMLHVDRMLTAEREMPSALPDVGDDS